MISPEGEGVNEYEGEGKEEVGDEDEEEAAPKGKAKGSNLVFDVVRRFAQPLGIDLPRWEGRVIETKKGVVRLFLKTYSNVIMVEQVLILFRSPIDRRVFTACASPLIAARVDAWHDGFWSPARNSG
ncbi:MAG: hypothetical protein JRI66_13345, partial [Deltaproteobacteria bacterium]|nr:hypothetical protein [Deltaproteobacteria bacterium]